VKKLFSYLINFAMIVSSALPAAGAQELEIIGFATDSQHTLWAALKVRQESALPEEKGLFGDWSSRSYKTIFGRVNTLMDLLSDISAFSELSIPVEFHSCLEEYVNLLLAPSSTIPIGRWFDRTDSCFGTLYKLSRMLMPECGTYNTCVLQSLVESVLPYASAATVKTCRSLFIEINAEQSIEALHNLFALLFPLYKEVVIGAPDTFPGEQPYAPLFAKWQNGKQSEAHYEHVANRLQRLKDFHPITIDQLLGYFTLVNGAAPSLISCLDGAVGSPFNTENCIPPTFFTIFNEIAQKCQSRDEKFRYLTDILGNSSNTLCNNTVFGKLAELVALQTSNDCASTFKKKWLFSQGESLCSGLEEIYNLLQAHAINEGTVDALVTLIGIPGDTQNSSLFGSMVSLKNCNDFETFAYAFGFSGEERSCFYFINSMKRRILAEGLQGPLPDNLHGSTILKVLDGDPTILQALNDGLPQLVVQASFVWRMENVLIPQLNNLRELFAHENPEIFGYIGSVLDFDKLSVFSKIQRLIKHLKEQTLTFDHTRIYSLLFFGADSLQSKIYEIYTRVAHGFAPDLIGGVLSTDFSLFGILNQCLRLIEVDPILQVLSPKLDTDGQVCGTIMRNLLEVCPKFAGEDLEAIKHIIGAEYKPEQIKASTIVDMIGFFYDVFAHMSVLCSYAELEEYTQLIFGEEQSLLAQSAALLQSSSRKEVTDITGYMFGQSVDGTICNTCLYICKNFYKHLQHIIVDTPAPDVQFWEEYQSKVRIFDIFLKTALSEKIKFNVVGFINELFAYNYIQQDSFTDFSALVEQPPTSFEHSKYFRLTSASTQMLKSVDKDITGLLHTLIISPYIHLLDEASVMLSKISEKLLSLSLLVEERSLIGEATDRVDTDAVIGVSGKQLSVFALFNEVLQIISSPSFFLASAKSLDVETPDAMGFWYFTVNQLTGSVYDTASSTSERTFFETIKRLIELLELPNLHEQQLLIKNTIGNENINPDSSYRSLFSILDATLKRLIPPYSKFALDHTSNTVGVGAGLARIHALFQSTAYQNLPSFQILSKIGNPIELSGFFKLLSECTDMFRQNSHLELLPMSMFLAYSKVLQREIENFIREMQYPQPKEEVEQFISNVDSLIAKLSSLGPCDGCARVVEFLQKMCMRLNEVGHSLSTKTNDDLIALFTNTSFKNIKKAALGLCSSVSRLKDKALLNASMRTTCIAQHSGEEFSAIEGQMNLLQDAIYEISPIIIPSVFAFSDNMMCQSLPRVVVMLADAIAEFASQLRTPVVSYIPYNEDNVRDFSEITGAASEIVNNVKSIFYLKNCKGCQDSELDIDQLTNAIQYFVNKMEQVNVYISESFIAQIACQLDQIAQSLQPISLSNLEDWTAFVLRTQVISADLQKLFPGLSSRKHITKTVESIDVLLEHVGATSPPSIQTTYTASSMGPIFISILEYINYLSQYWDSFVFQDNRIIPILEDLLVTYGNIDMAISQGTWIDELSSITSLIRERFHQGVCVNLATAITRLKEHCTDNFVEQLQALASQSSRMPAVLEQCPGLSDAESILPKWGEHMHNVAEIMTAAASRLPAISCVHLHLFDDIFKITAIVEQNNVDIAEALSITRSAVAPISLDEVPTKLRASLDEVDSWWNRIESTATSMSSCRHSLSNALISLQSSYAIIGQNAELIFQSSICGYSNLYFGDIASHFIGRAGTLTNILQIISSDLACKKHLALQMSTMAALLEQINGKIANVGQLEGIMSSQSVPVLSRNVTAVNTEIHNLIAFLASEGTCIGGAVPALVALNTPLKNIAREICDIILDEPEDGATEKENIFLQMQQIESHAEQISQQLLSQSFNYIPSLLHISDSSEMVLSVGVLSMEIMRSSELLATLARAINTSAPVFASCFGELEQLAAPLRQISGYMADVSFVVQHVHEKLNELMCQQGFLVDCQNMSMFMHKDEESQRGWMDRIERTDTALVQSDAELRRQLGYLHPGNVIEHSFKICTPKITEEVSPK
jgi:hypothetical protein